MKQINSVDETIERVNNSWLQEEEDEDTKDMDANAESVIERCSNLVEAKYLMQHLFNYSLEQSVSATKFEAANKVDTL